MSVKMSWTAAAGLFVLLSTAAFAMQEAKSGNPEAAKLKNPVASTPESIAEGAGVFKRRCAACHGADAKGGPPKEDFMSAASNLVDDKWDHGSTDGEIFYVIKNGVPPDLVMDGWGERLSDHEIWSLVNFLRDSAKPNHSAQAVKTPSVPVAGKTTKDGVYADAQATRGKAAYGDKCGACHGEDLSGGGFAPALTADGFFAGWGGQKLDGLFSRVKDTMPADRPGSLTGDQAADIVAYILKVNNLPAGVALANEMAPLAQITITKP